MMRDIFVSSFTGIRAIYYKHRKKSITSTEQQQNGGASQKPTPTKLWWHNGSSSIYSVSLCWRIRFFNLRHKAFRCHGTMCGCCSTTQLSSSARQRRRQQQQQMAGLCYLEATSNLSLIIHRYSMSWYIVESCIGPHHSTHCFISTKFCVAILVFLHFVCFDFCAWRWAIWQMVNDACVHNDAHDTQGTRSWGTIENWSRIFVLWQSQSATLYLVDAVQRRGMRYFLFLLYGSCSIWIFSTIENAFQEDAVHPFATMGQYDAASVENEIGREYGWQIRQHKPSTDCCTRCHSFP